jgi:hypothetical protein
VTGEAPERVSASPDDTQRDEPIEHPDTNRLAMVDNMQIMANKGWLPERKLMVVHDFFMARGLYADFNAFIRRMK